MADKSCFEINGRRVSPAVDAHKEMAEYILSFFATNGTKIKLRSSLIRFAAKASAPGTVPAVSVIIAPEIPENESPDATASENAGGYPNIPPHKRPAAKVAVIVIMGKSRKALLVFLRLYRFISPPAENPTDISSR